jgi:hypothetical protein
LNACKNTQEEMQVNSPESPMQYSKPSVKIVDGTMVFPTLEEFQKATAFVEHSTDVDLIAWQDELDFKSSKYYYVSAKNIMCCPTSKQDIETLKAQFGENLMYDFENADYSPTYPLGISNWLLNSKGEFYIGEYLTKYTDDRLMNILYPTEQKIQQALSSIDLDDTVENIYVHPLYPKGATDRGCNSFGIDLCDLGPRFNSSMNKAITESYGLYADQSQKIGTLITFWYSYHVKFHAKKKNFLGGWTICDRQYWTYSNSYSMNVSFYPNPAFTLAGPPSLNYSRTNFTTGYECSYGHDFTIIQGNVPLSAVALFNSRSLSWSGMSLSVSASENLLSLTGTCP